MNSLTVLTMLWPKMKSLLEQETGDLRNSSKDFATNLQLEDGECWRWTWPDEARSPPEADPHSFWHFRFRQTDFRPSSLVPIAAFVLRENFLSRRVELSKLEYFFYFNLLEAQKVCFELVRSWLMIVSKVTLFLIHLSKFYVILFNSIITSIWKANITLILKLSKKVW